VVKKLTSLYCLQNINKVCWITIKLYVVYTRLYWWLLEASSCIVLRFWSLRQVLGSQDHLVEPASENRLHASHPSLSSPGNNSMFVLRLGLNHEPLDQEMHYLFICSLFNCALSVTQNEGMISECWIGKDIEGSGHGLIYGTSPAFAWRDWEKKQKSSVRIAGLWAKIWNRDLLNTKQGC
jgi:hypothetical protein